MAVEGKIRAHKGLMIFLTLGAWVFISGYFFNQSYDMREQTLPVAFIIWIAFHGTIGLLVLIGASGLVISRLRGRGRDAASESHFNRYHKLYGRALVVLWLFSHLGGIFNALFLQ